MKLQLFSDASHAIGRDEVITRAETWLNPPVPYSQVTFIAIYQKFQISKLLSTHIFINICSLRTKTDTVPIVLVTCQWRGTLGPVILPNHSSGSRPPLRRVTWKRVTFCSKVAVTWLFFTVGRTLDRRDIWVMNRSVEKLGRRRNGTFLTRIGTELPGISQGDIITLLKIYQ